MRLRARPPRARFVGSEICVRVDYTDPLLGGVHVQMQMLFSFQASEAPGVLQRTAYRFEKVFEGSIHG